MLWYDSGARHIGLVRAVRELELPEGKRTQLKVSTRGWFSTVLWADEVAQVLPGRRGSEGGWPQTVAIYRQKAALAMNSADVLAMNPTYVSVRAEDLDYLCEQAEAFILLSGRGNRPKEGA